MKSLRHQLLLGLLPVFAIAAGIAAVANYLSYGRTVNWFMDSQMRALVDSQAASADLYSKPLTTTELVMKGAVATQVWSVDGRLLSSTYPALEIEPYASDGFTDVTGQGTRWRVYTMRNAHRVVQGAQSIAFREHVIRGQAMQSGLPILLMIPVTGVLLWLAIRRAVRRLEIVAQAAAARDEHSLHELPAEHAPTEIRPLVDAVNRLLARLAEAFSAQRRFVQDAAHELRTPLTALSLQLENVKARASHPETKSQLAMLEAGVARMKRLTNQLLRLARQEAMRPALEKTNVNVTDLLREIVAEVLPLAERRDIDIGLHSSDIPAVRGTREDVRALLHNLIDNAVSYCRAGGRVDIAVDQTSDGLDVRIADEGPGIPEALLPRVFDRFFRIEGTSAEGSGLGLAIAEHAAEQVGAQLLLQNRTDRLGLLASVRFVPAVNTNTPHQHKNTHEHLPDELPGAQPGETFST